MPGNHNKKPSERRDSLKQQQRKNNPTGNRPKDPQSQNTNTSNNNSNKPNPHTSHRANTPPVAIATNTASGGNTPSTPPLGHTLQPLTATTTGSNGFNTSVVTQFLNKRFSDTLAAYHDDSNPETRPEKYESQEKAWGNKGGLPSVWGQKSGLMANGNDMLTELLK